MIWQANVVCVVYDVTSEGSLERVSVILCQSALKKKNKHFLSIRLSKLLKIKIILLSIALNFLKHLTIHTFDSFPDIHRM